MTQTETDLQHDIMLHIGSRPYLRIWRQNIGVAITQDGSRYIRFGQPGAADLTGMFACGIRVELEIKRPGGKQSKEQKRFQRIIDVMGGLYAIVTSMETADDILAMHLQGCNVCSQRTKWNTQN